jgi:shikimate dehydrogenase
MIRGTTTLIAHIGYPTESFKAPMIYNPYFEQQGIDAIVMPMGVKGEDYPQFLASLRKLTNLRGALITMPHKVTTVSLVDEVTPTAKIAGACNAILLRPDGSLLGDMFDGAGFVRGVERKGIELGGASALVVGCGGVGSRSRRRSRPRASRRSASSTRLPRRPTALADRLRRHYPKLEVSTGSNDPAGYRWS